MNQNHLFYRIVNAVLRLLLAGVVFVLFLHSIFSTSFVGRLILADGSGQERTFNIADSPLRHLLVFLAATAVLLIGRQTVRTLKGLGGMERREGVLVRHREVFFWGLPHVTLVLGTAYVLITKQDT